MVKRERVGCTTTVMHRTKYKLTGRERTTDLPHRLCTTYLRRIRTKASNGSAWPPQGPPLTLYRYDDDVGLR